MAWMQSAIKIVQSKTLGVLTRTPVVRGKTSSSPASSAPLLLLLSMRKSTIFCQPHTAQLPARRGTDRG